MNSSSPMKPRRLVSVLGIEIVSASSSVVLNSTRRAVVLWLILFLPSALTATAP